MYWGHACVVSTWLSLLTFEVHALAGGRVIDLQRRRVQRLQQAARHPSSTRLGIRLLTETPVLRRWRTMTWKRSDDETCSKCATVASPAARSRGRRLRRNRRPRWGGPRAPGAPGSAAMAECISQHSKNLAFTATAMERHHRTSGIAAASQRRAAGVRRNERLAACGRSDKAQGCEGATLTVMT